ncbi:restriction endonuclease [Nostoc sp. UHCC 0252]|uniref:restriction endonuclease n=1 Tax=Nostoc sp. UHCC 0252 TaxID=3110241 RepID=UPI002B21B8FC|nr:restriction endonuclease [Nostoc sp. UHCC 0252]MEA5604899.1 restriction endonuclease [Nostoc sp. UHCC 0252]
MDYLEIDALINGIIYSDSVVKQDLGRRFAAYLGLKPGKIGADGGIDGEGEVKGRQIYFQSKLSKKPIEAPYAAEFCGNLGIHKADIGVMLAGVGYTSQFKSRLNKCPNIGNLKIYLLTLEDIFGETNNFKGALIDLPPLRDLSSDSWTNYR